MSLNTISYALAVGLINGLFWSLALNFSVENGLLYGGLTGAFLGMFLSFLNKTVIGNGNVQKSESSFVVDSVLGILLILGIIAGILAWFVRFRYY